MKRYVGGLGIVRWLVRWFRMRLACAKWNRDIPLILAMAATNKDGAFKWSQLVWQEVWMYIHLAEQVEPDEFDALCKRRGFDAMMREYLAAMLRRVGLGRRMAASARIQVSDEASCCAFHKEERCTKHE